MFRFASRLLPMSIGPIKPRDARKAPIVAVKRIIAIRDAGFDKVLTALPIRAQKMWLSAVGLVSKANPKFGEEFSAPKRFKQKQFHLHR